jgi:hypothetical protein
MKSVEALHGANGMYVGRRPGVTRFRNLGVVIGQELATRSR